MKNIDLVYRFVHKDCYYKGSNMHSYKDTLFSFYTAIAQWYNNVLIINTHKFSPTTSRHLNYVKNMAEKYNKKVILVDVGDIGTTRLIPPELYYQKLVIKKYGSK